MTDQYEATGRLLLNISRELDITEAQYQDAVDKYTAVARHLARPESQLSPYRPDIKPQGSFLLGTMIKPLGETGRLDVDLVCRLYGKREDWTQRHVKEAVGQQLKASEPYARMLDEEGNRCWTLVYDADGTSRFHMDILPAIVGYNHFTLRDRSFSDHDADPFEASALRITDKRLPDYSQANDLGQWLKSNPFGYAAWFRRRAALSSARSFSDEAIEPLPGYRKEKEPLIRVVQLLKRHRDRMYGSGEYKPISIIITTLAAQAYREETNLLLAVNNTLRGMEDLIETRYSEIYRREVKWVSNPVNPGENFADRWADGPEGALRERFFLEWLQQARSDFRQLQQGGIPQAFTFSKTILGIDHIAAGDIRYTL